MSYQPHGPAGRGPTTAVWRHGLLVLLGTLAKAASAFSAIVLASLLLAMLARGPVGAAPLRNGPAAGADAPIAGAEISPGPGAAMRPSRRR